MNRYAIEDAARTVIDACAGIGPARGYTGAEYNGRPRLDSIAEMVAALDRVTLDHEFFCASNPDHFDAVLEILSGENYHTEALAFALAKGGHVDAIASALQTVHYMGQSYAIENGLERPEAV